MDGELVERSSEDDETGEAYVLEPDVLSVEAGDSILDILEGSEVENSHEGVREALSELNPEMYHKTGGFDMKSYFFRVLDEEDTGEIYTVEVEESSDGLESVNVTEYRSRPELVSKYF